MGFFKSFECLGLYHFRLKVQCIHSFILKQCYFNTGITQISFLQELFFHVVCPVLRRTPLIIVGLLPTPAPWTTLLSPTWPTTKVRWYTTREMVAMMMTILLIRSKRSPWLVIRPRAWLSAALYLPGATVPRPTEHLRSDCQWYLM